MQPSLLDMKYKVCLMALATLAVACTSSQNKKNDIEVPSVNLILDTDMGPDYDDVGAMALMYSLADSGQVNVLATLASNKNEFVVPCIDVINNYYGYSDMPIGAPKGDAPNLTTWHKGDKWTELLPSKFMHKVASTSVAPNAVEVYRRVLSQQPDSSVTICTIGFFSNLAELLKSEADSISPLSGIDLIGSKVKLLVSMAGLFPGGEEFNIICDYPAAAYAINNWPTPIIFSGFEIGEKILTGKGVAQTADTLNPVSMAYAASLAQDNPQGRNSWDQTAVLVACKGVYPYFNVEKGRISIDASSGKNSWVSDVNGPHAYLTWRQTSEQLAALIDGYMKHLPVK